MIPTEPAVAPDRRPARPRRARLVGLLVAVAVVVLAGCQVDNTPKGYETGESGTVVQANFVATCTGTQPNADNTTTSLAAKSYCECAFAAIRELVPFDDADRDNAKYAGYSREAPTFHTLDNDLMSDPNAVNRLPQNVKDAVTACPTGAGPVPGTTAGTTPR